MKDEKKLKKGCNGRKPLILKYKLHGTNNTSFLANLLEYGFEIMNKRNKEEQS
jgi:hypothetical protein